MHRLEKPIVAAVNGWALAGGLETALACDIRIASDRAMFGSFEARRGYHHGDGGLVRLVNACGTSGRLAHAPDRGAGRRGSALQWAWSTKIVPHEELIDEAEKVARQILRNSSARCARRSGPSST